MLKAKLIGLQEGASVIGVSPHTLYRWCTSGRCSSHKLGGRRLVSIDEIDRMVRDSEQPRAVERSTHIAGKAEVHPAEGGN